MFIAILVVFIVGYLAIALEHPLRINKAASALLTGVAIWLLIMFGRDVLFANAESFKEYLTHHAQSDLIGFIVHGEIPKALGEIAQILFFLLAAMTIVEIIDVHNGFSIITDRITARKKIPLIWLLSFITFFLSAVLDNLTTAIVMMALLRRLIADKTTRLYFASLIVIAANSGGAWSPIGDVTTIMLWIGGQVTAKTIILRLIVPSLISIIVPLIIVSFFMKGDVVSPENASNNGLCHSNGVTKREGLLVFCLGVGGLIFVPIFKTITHLPPYLGMLLSLGILWVVTEIMHWHKDQEVRSKLAVAAILRRIDTPTILFFLGILTAVSGLATAGHLKVLGEYLDHTFHDYFSIDLLIGILSAVVDNVPLVAGAMGMYPIHTERSLAAITDPAAREFASLFIRDGFFWELLAYCAGTGGSIFIIGSAAGVAVMGMEKINFIWYLKRISWIALAGYLAGAIAYRLMF